MSWNRAMDEVRADRLTEKHGKNALLVIIHEWPQAKKYKDKPELIPSLEYLVRTGLRPAFLYMIIYFVDWTLYQGFQTVSIKCQLWTLARRLWIRGKM